jgi:hypothetical protein
VRSTLPLIWLTFLSALGWKPLTEAQWLACEDPDALLEFLRGRASPRKLRLFAVACCRRIWHLLPDEGTRRGVEVAERYADGAASDEELEAARSAAQEAVDRYFVHLPAVAAEAVAEAAWGEDQYSGTYHPQFAAYHAYFAAGEAAGERVAQSLLLRDVIGNPFRSTSVDPAWLAWNGSTVRRLAQAVYDERTFDRLPILADALEDAGCADAAILGHCRGPGPHMRGCWVLDLVLGKQ